MWSKGQLIRIKMSAYSYKAWSRQLQTKPLDASWRYSYNCRLRVNKLCSRWREVCEIHLKADDSNKPTPLRLKEIHRLTALMQVYLPPTIAYIKKYLALHVWCYSKDPYKERIPPNTLKKTPIRKRLPHQGRDVNLYYYKGPNTLTSQGTHNLPFLAL